MVSARRFAIEDGAKMDVSYQVGSLINDRSYTEWRKMKMAPDVDIFGGWVGMRLRKVILTWGLIYGVCIKRMMD